MLASRRTLQGDQTPPHSFLFGIPGEIYVNSFISRIAGSKATKGAVVGVMAVAAIGLAAPMSSAAHESSWTYGCRGYWYSTSGHSYCNYAGSDSYQTTYDCNAELDTQKRKSVRIGFEGKMNTHECTFKINKTRVGLWI